MQETNKHKANNSYFSPKTQQILNLRLTISPCSPYAFRTVEKSTVSRGKLNDLSKANSTPKACFFVRSIRTPKERLKMACSSMVERKGKGSPFAVFLLKRFSTPLRSTAHRGKSDGRLSKNLLSKAFTMIYKFLSIQGNKRLKITIYANSKAEALSRIQWLNKPLCIVSNLKAQGGVYA